MTTWQALRTQIQRTVLKDPNANKYSEESLLDAYTWAIQTLCEHTALATGVTYTGATATEYDLPSDLYAQLEVAGAVILTDGTTVAYLNPVRYDDTLTKPHTAEQGFYTWGDKLILTSAPSATDAKVEVRYFAYYPTPVSDSDELKIPRWAEGAVAILAGAYALTANAVSYAGINQWKEDPEKGTPESNAVRSQADWMIKQYNIIVSRHPRQDRENFFRR